MTRRIKEPGTPKSTPDKLRTIKRTAATVAAISTTALAGCGGSAEKASTEHVGTVVPVANKANSNLNQAPKQETINNRSLEEAKKFLREKMKTGESFELVHIENGQQPEQPIDVEVIDKSGDQIFDPLLLWTKGDDGNKNYIGTIGVQLPKEDAPGYDYSDQSYPIKLFRAQDSKVIAPRTMQDNLRAATETASFSNKAGDLVGRKGMKAITNQNNKNIYGGALESTPERLDALPREFVFVNPEELLNK